MEYVRYIQALIEEQKALGAVEGEVVSEYGHIPLIVPEAYNIYTFAPLTEEQLALVEQNIGREIPCQYRTFLTNVSNGIHIFHRCLHLYGLQGKKSEKHPTKLHKQHVTFSKRHVVSSKTSTSFEKTTHKPVKTSENCDFQSR